MSPVLNIFNEDGESIEKHDLLISINTGDDPEKRIVWLAPIDYLKIQGRDENWQIEIQFEEFFELIAEALRRKSP